SHFLTDVRLALGYSAVIIAAATFALDYKLGWDKTKELTLWAVVVYFVLNSALTYWIWAVEKGKIFTGVKAGALISISSQVQKNIPLYNLTIRTSPSSFSSWQTIKISAPFTRWFDEEGFFVALPFQQWLASEVPIIGQADSKRLTRTLKEELESVQEKEVESIEKDELQSPKPKGAKADKGTNSARAGTPAAGTRSRKGKN
ncbi:hypothetical protein MMC31_003625, partial [Peltigera leucophlebia]|nr:hypothetical protein [Peltigera leucophlebia]